MKLIKKILPSVQSESVGILFGKLGLRSVDLATWKFLRISEFMKVLYYLLKKFLHVTVRIFVLSSIVFILLSHFELVKARPSFDINTKTNKVTDYNGVAAPLIVDPYHLSSESEILIDHFSRESNEASSIVVAQAELPVLTITNTSFSVIENISDNPQQTGFVVNFELSAAASSPVTFNYSMTDITTTKSSDYTEVANRRVNISANTTSGSFTIPIINDVISERNESFTLTLSNPTGANLITGTTLSKVITIIDDDRPQLKISNTTFNVNENVSGSKFTANLVLSKAISESISVRYSAINSTAIEGEDYTLQDAILTFPPGVAAKSISIPIIDDSKHEGNETFSLVLSNLVGAEFENGTSISKTITIIDDESPTLSITNTTFNVAEDVGNDGFDLELELSGPTSNNVQLRLEVTGGTATAGVDFTRTPIDIAFSPSEISQKVNFDIIEDFGFEREETIEFTLSSLSGAVFADGGNSFSGMINIVEDRVAAISIPDTNIIVSENASGGEITVDVRLDFATKVDVEFDVNLENGTAMLNQDFRYLTGTNPVTINAGELETSVSIGIIDDTTGEGDESFAFNINNVVGAEILGGGTSIRRTVKIIDNETPTLNVPSILEDELFYEGQHVGLALWTLEEVDHEISVDYSTESGTARVGTDIFVPGNSSKKIAPGFNSIEYNFFGVPSNETRNGHKTFKIHFRNLTGAVFADGTRNKTFNMKIIDDESLELDITSPSSNFEVNEEQGELVVNATLPTITATDVSFTYNLTNGTATKTLDFTEVQNRTVTIPSSTRTATFAIPIINDAISENEENFTINFTSISNAVFSGGGRTYSKTVTINANDLPTVSISETEFFVNEDAGNLEVTVNLSHASWKAIPFTFFWHHESTTAGSGNSSGADFTLDRSPKEIAAGETSKTFRIPIINDNDVEGNEVFYVFFIWESGAVLLPLEETNRDRNRTTRRITIIDDDSPTISITTTNFEVYENVVGGIFVVNLALSSTTSNTVSFEYNMTDVTTTKGSDYTEATNRTVTIGSGRTGSFSIPIINDSDNEGNETFTFTLSNLVGASQFSNNELTISKTVTIIDNELATLEFTNTNFNVFENVGNSGFVVGFELSGPVNYDVYFSYVLNADSADESSDYMQPSYRSKTILMGSTTSSIIIPIVDDDNVEGTETFDLVVTIASGAKFDGDQSIATKTITILDDEKPTLSFKTTQFSIDEDTSEEKIEVEVMLSVVTHQNVTFNYNMVDVSTTKGEDYTESADRTIRISAGETTKKLSIPITDDSSNEGNETFTLTLSNLSGAVFASEVGSISETITIVDDEIPTLTFTTTNFIVNEDIGSSGFTVNVKLSGPTNKNVTFDYGMTDVSTTKISDYTEVTNRTVTISTGNTTGSFSIPIINDIESEGNEKFTLTLSDVSNAVFDGETDTISKTVEIFDDELPILSISTSNFSIFEDDKSSKFVLEVMLNGETEQNVSFDYGISDITATYNVDYTEESNRTISILAGNTSGAISIPIVDDAEIEENESFVVTLFNLSGAKFANVSKLSQTITIIDDDSRILSFSDTELSVAENVGSSGLEVTLLLSEITSQDVTFEFSMLDGSATLGLDYFEVTNRTATIDANANTGSFAIPILNDDIAESSESFTIYLFNLVGANFANGNSVHSKPVVIIDDETPTIAITTANLSVGEDAGTSGITVGVELLNSSSYAVSFNYSTESITAMMGTDFPRTSGTVTIAASDTTGSFSIPISEDTEAEQTETFKIN